MLSFDACSLSTIVSASASVLTNAPSSPPPSGSDGALSAPAASVDLVAAASASVVAAPAGAAVAGAAGVGAAGVGAAGAAGVGAAGVAGAAGAAAGVAGALGLGFSAPCAAAWRGRKPSSVLNTATARLSLI